MTNELLKNYVGKSVNISMGSMGASFAKVKIQEIVDNWIRVEDHKGKTDLVNSEYIQSIKIVEVKQ